MKLTKFSHACVLVEDDTHTTLFDPGEFAWESGLFKLDTLSKLDYVLITHEHFDHCHQPFVAALIQKFPAAQFISTPEVAEQLKQWGAKKVATESDEHVQVTPHEHASMAPLAPTPPCQNVRFDYKGAITHPGDSIQFDDSKGILFLPLAGPWEAPIEAVRLGEQLKPKVIVPIHDWMWNDEWRLSMYDRLVDYYGQQNIQFLKLINGEPVTIDI
jgi:L-ascorbate metabolism protein UlaG (beta-lactamase superfamily)